MKTNRFDYLVVVNELKPSLGENKFFAKLTIHEIGTGAIEHNIGEVWGKTREESYSKMKTLAEQLIKVLEKN
jgi:hypothetical protein